MSDIVQCKSSSYFSAFAKSLIILVTLIGLKGSHLCLKGDVTAAEQGIPRCLAQTSIVHGLDSISLNVTGCLIGGIN